VESPFGQATRMRVLQSYLAQAGAVTAENAWQHVYRCLLWTNQGAGLAHIYDSNHMQPGGNFHSRAVRFTEELCRLFGITRAELPAQIDYLFKGCVAEWQRTRPVEVDPEIESELISAFEKILREGGLAADRVPKLARQLESLSRDFFTIGNKRKNALGEGFEDLLYLLLIRVAHVPPEKIALRKPVSQLPGFRRAPVRKPGTRGEREPHPDIALTEGGITHVITSAKWSMRQDRETQFQAEYTAYQMNKTQPTELRFALITNEFDVARLTNVARAMPGGAGGYIFHQIYHINPALLVHTQGDRIGAVQHWIGAGKILALSDYLTEMSGRFGSP
jgi:hypothetical protein